jgi:hypothetical protein
MFLHTRVSRVLYQAGFREYSPKAKAGHIMVYVPGTNNSILALHWRDDQSDLEPARMNMRLGRIMSMLQQRSIPVYAAVGRDDEPFLFINGIPILKDRGKSAWSIPPLRELKK